MKTPAYFVAWLLIAFAPTLASAAPGFTFSIETVQGVASASAFDFVRVYAKLTPDPIPGQPFSGATGLQSIDATMYSQGTFKFNFFDQSADGIADWDPTGAFTTTDANGRFNNTTSAGTFIRPGAPVGGGTIFMAASTPVLLKSTDNDFNGQADPGTEQTVYMNLKSFRVAAVIQGGKDTTAVSDPKGALFAKAVVPHGAGVTVMGTVAADVGPNNIAFWESNFEGPEPTSLGLIAFLGLILGRRRRVA